MLTKSAINILASLIPSKVLRKRVRNFLGRKYLFRHSFVLCDSPGSSFKEYILASNMREIFENLRSGLDPDSLHLLDTLMYRIMNYPDTHMAKNVYIREEEFFDAFATDIERRYREDLETNSRRYREEVFFPEKYQHFIYSVEVFSAHHGLKDCGDKVKAYLEDKEFIDGGSYIGDSASVFQRYYRPKCVHSFDPDSVCGDVYTKVMALNKVPEEKYVFVPKGLSDDDAIMDGGGLGSAINVTSVDSYVKGKDVDIGFVKLDVEGFGLRALKGMAGTIRRCRPVLSLSIYHNPEEFFGMKPELDRITADLDYKKRLIYMNASPWRMNEINILAYPFELDA